MGNYISHRTVASPSTKLVLSDGTVLALDHATTVAELMFDHPSELVFELRSLVTNGTKATPLPADHELESNKAYVMLPTKGNKVPKMSREDARMILKKSRSAKCQRVTLVIEEEEERKGESGAGVEEMFVDRPEFLVRQMSSRRWRPSLDTIEERMRERKVSHWLF